MNALICHCSMLPEMEISTQYRKKETYRRNDNDYLFVQV